MTPDPAIPARYVTWHRTGGYTVHVAAWSAPLEDMGQVAYEWSRGTPLLDECPMCGWGVGTNPGSCGECAESAPEPGQYGYEEPSTVA